VKVVSILKYLFIAVGIVWPVGAAFAYKKCRAFLRNALYTHRIIVSFAEWWRGGPISYRPDIKFVSGHGRIRSATYLRSALRAQYKPLKSERVEW
jgi:hypothetical protein